MDNEDTPQSPLEGTPHSRLHAWAAEIIDALLKNGERVDGLAVGRQLMAKAENAKDAAAIKILAIEGAYQFAMRSILDHPVSKAEKEKAKKEKSGKQKDLNLFEYNGIRLPKNEVDILKQITIARVRTKSFGYVLIATARSSALREAIALREPQIETMTRDNDLMEELAKIRDLIP